MTKNLNDPFGALLSVFFFDGEIKIDGDDAIEELMKLDREEKLTKDQREFWIPPEYRSE